jgi:hypothetical protein
MSRTELKHKAQDELLGGMANAILAHLEGAYGEPDKVLLEEMHKQAQRAMKLFGVNSYPGLGEVK